MEMKKIGQKIAQLRKNSGYTQEQLSSRLNITPQAISKWEKGYSLPDTALLPNLAKVLDTSIDALFLADGKSPYDENYQEEGFYWGLQHSPLAEKIVLLMQDRLQKESLRLLDIGSGEGRDAIYFAKQGFVVDALEISVPGVEKIKQYSEQACCKVNIFNEDMLDFKVIKDYDIIYSMGTLQFLPLQRREIYFKLLKEQTKENGINAHLIFVEKPFIKTAPDWQENEYFYLSGDLARVYQDWEIVYNEEKIMDCSSSNVAHQHAVNSILAMKVLE